METAQERKIIVHGLIFDGEIFLKNKAILIEGNKVAGVIDPPLNDSNFDVIDANGLLIAPAFIDLQINGGGGKLFTEEPTVETLRTMSLAHEKFGVLHTLPTVISTDLDTMLRAIDATKQAQHEDIGILGVHLEGPYLNEKKAGIHEKKYIHAADLTELERLYATADDVIQIMTIAPEAFDKTCLDYAIRKGTKIFIGHSNADFASTYDYLTHGATGVTHLFNAMSQLNSREPGIVGASYLTENSWAGIIADGFHVALENVRISKSLKQNKLFLVTDAMPPVGIGDYEFRIGETEIHCFNGKCLSNDGTIAGSALNMNKALQNVVKQCGIPLDEALRMTSTYQAEMLNLSDKLGFIRAGNNADLVFLNDDLQVVRYVKRGILHEQNGIL